MQTPMYLFFILKKHKPPDIANTNLKNDYNDRARPRLDPLKFINEKPGYTSNNSIDLQSPKYEENTALGSKNDARGESKSTRENLSPE